MTESGRRPSCAARPVASLLPALPVAFFVLLPGTGGKREHFVVPDSGRDVPITGTPVDESVENRRCIDDRAGVHRACRGIRGLPEDVPRFDVESAPGSPGDRLPGGHEGIGQMVVVSDGNVDALTVGCGAPFDPAQRAARADRRGPDDWGTA